MTSNYFTLARIAKELEFHLVGTTLLEAYSFRPDEVRLRFDEITLVAVLKPIHGALFFSPFPEARPARNTRTFFEEASGKEVMSVIMSDVDRQVTLEFDDDLALTFSYFGHPNACLSREEQLLGCFKRNGFDRVTNHVEPSSTVDQRVGKKLMKEVEYRFQTYQRDLEELADSVMRELRTGSEAYVYRKGDSVVMSPIRLFSYEHAGWEREDHPTTNEAVRAAVISSGKQDRLRAKRASLVNHLTKALERTQQSLADMQHGLEFSNRAERHAAVGNALLMQAQEIPKGSTDVTLEIEGRPERVTLDPALSPYENAQKYFERSRLSRARKTELAERTRQLKNNAARFERMIQEVGVCDDLRSLEMIELSARREHPEQLRAPSEGPAFRKYVVAGGWTVLVGKNAKQNDELTTKYAKKEDIWLHARGVPGSHVVLQAPGSKPKSVPKEAIEQAAEIAAFYSDAKTQTVAPVSYTQKKFVRKPKGAEPGTVIMEREEVIMVRPQLRGVEK